MTEKRQKVYAALSGGVDSAVAAALLKARGFDVVGVFIKIVIPEFGDPDATIGTGCDWRAERRDAMRVSARLGLPFATLDLSHHYRQAVVDYLIREYRAGRTPNPDVRCNQAIKFGAFFEEARRRGAHLVATGHYARLCSGRLLTAVDTDKDQTYFLWSIKKEIIKDCLFPIGDYQKNEVRKLAKEFNLPNAAKPDSQGLCFLGDVDFKNFLTTVLPKRLGVVLNERGEVIGEHDGAHLYTIGERHGFRLFRRGPAEGPRFVVAKNLERNELTVAVVARLPDWSQSSINLSATNWLTDPPQTGKTYGARLRYRAPLVPGQVELEPEEGRARLIFNEPQKNLAPGQSCVLYDGEICLGGGVIELN